MGLFRLLLAIAVLVDHTADPTIFGFRLISSAFAVEIFFMLSGFYMALILDHTYHGRDAWWLFMKNRFLRLYPIYWIVALLTIPVHVYYAMTYVSGISSLGRPNVIANATFIYPGVLDGLSLLLLVISQFTIVGQDLVWFLAIDGSGLHSIREYVASEARRPGQMLELFRFLLVPQAWTLSLEMMFYALAPFISRQRTPIVLAMLLGALAFRGWLYLDGDLMNYTVWKDKFFLAELWAFLTGIVVYRAYRHLLPHLKSQPAVRWSPFTLVGILLLYPYLPDVRIWMLYSVVAMLIPFAFFAVDRAASEDASSRIRDMAHWDRYLGDLSYPVYISHVLVLQLAYQFVAGITSVPPSPLLTPAVLLGTIALSMLLLHFVAGPIERIRARIRTEAGTLDRASRRREARAQRR